MQTGSYFLLTTHNRQVTWVQQNTHTHSFFSFIHSFLAPDRIGGAENDVEDRRSTYHKAGACPGVLGGQGQGALFSFFAEHSISGHDDANGVWTGYRRSGGV